MLLFQKPMEGRSANPKPTTVSTELPVKFDIYFKDISYGIQRLQTAKLLLLLLLLILMG